MPRALSWFLLHTPAAVPEVVFADLPSTVTQSRPQTPEAEPLLCEKTNPDECELCCRKRRKTSFQAYPTRSVPVVQPRCKSRARGCVRLLVELKHIACCSTSKRRYQLLTRFRYYKQSKPFTAISVHVEQLTSETYEEDDVAGVFELIEVIRLQATGPTEAARAIRKKLKYGSVHRQLRALTILDGVLQNGGTRVQRPILSDGPLLERLRIAAIDPVSDSDVRAKCKVLFGQWVASSKEQPGLDGAKSLYNQLPKKQKAPQQRREQSKVLRETEEQAQQDEDEDVPIDPRRSRGASLSGTPEPSNARKNSATPITLSSASTFGTNKKVKKDKNKKAKLKLFNLEKEKPAILQSIAASSVASTNLNNALKLINREHKRVSDDTETMKRFETCKQLRRQILRYIQYVEAEEFLGGLIHANEELVASLMAFEVLDKSVDDDSDSEMEEAQHLSRQEQKKEEAALKDTNARIGQLNIKSPLQSPAKPPRPTSIPMPQSPNITIKSPPLGASRPPIVVHRPNVGNKYHAREVENGSDLESASSDDDDDPFGDGNMVKTPDPSKAGNKFTWKEV